MAAYCARSEVRCRIAIKFSERLLPLLLDFGIEFLWHRQSPVLKLGGASNSSNLVFLERHLFCGLGACRVSRHRALSRFARRNPQAVSAHPGDDPVAQKMCYHFSMTEFDSLQERIDAIRATGDAELAARAYRALSKVLFEFTREKTSRVGPNVPIIQRVNVTDVERLLSDLGNGSRSR